MPSVIHDCLNSPLKPLFALPRGSETKVGLYGAPGLVMILYKLARCICWHWSKLPDPATDCRRSPSSDSWTGALKAAASCSGKKQCEPKIQACFTSLSIRYLVAVALLCCVFQNYVSTSLVLPHRHVTHPEVRQTCRWLEPDSDKSARLISENHCGVQPMY